MRIGIQTWGSLGDIRPFIALANGLKASGHEVSLFVTSVDGVEYHDTAEELYPDIKQVSSSVIMDAKKLNAVVQSIVDTPSPLIQTKIIFSKLFLPAEKEMFREAELLCQNNDLVIGHFFHYPLHIAAEKYRCRYISVIFAHAIIPSVNRPLRGPSFLVRLCNKMNWKLIRWGLNKYITPYVNRMRTENAMPFVKDLITETWMSNELNLIAVSHNICDRPDDWDERYQVCGFLNMPSTISEGDMSSGLQSFMDNGEPPVYITFGSLMPAGHKEQKETIDLLTEAVRKANCRAIIQAKCWNDQQLKCSDNIHFVDHAPHELVFPGCAAVVHHGGAGTTQTATLAGTPSIIVYHIAEQKFWGSELKRLGIAPKVLSRRRLTSNALAKKITFVLGNAEMKRKANILGELMKNEDGVSKAVDIINTKYH
jgi:UDP:flavonoid glycosyltransferase YjiC (YdhE family)